MRAEEDIKGVYSMNKLKHNKKSDQLFLEMMMLRQLSF